MVNIQCISITELNVVNIQCKGITEIKLGKHTMYRYYRIKKRQTYNVKVFRD